MGYYFEHNEPVPVAIRRILAELLDEAATELSPENNRLSDGVHNARKCFKKIRCLLYLVRDELDKDCYKEKETRFKNMGRQLSVIRDAEAIIEAYDKLGNHIDHKLPTTDEMPQSLRAALVQRLHHLGVTQPTVKGAVFQLSQELKEQCLSLDHWPINYRDFSSIAARYRHNYKRGKQLLKQVYQNPTDNNFHRWRKRTKAFGYHSRLLRECSPEVMTQRITTSKALEDLLGQDHDLSVLRAVLKHPNPKAAQKLLVVDCLDKSTCKAIRRRAKQQQQYLRQKAHSLGEQLYDLSSTALYQDTLTHWNLW
jgi:CHAD domain-containing protein